MMREPRLKKRLERLLTITESERASKSWSRLLATLFVPAMCLAAGIRFDPQQENKNSLQESALWIACSRHPLLVNAAKEAVLKWIYQPVRVDGKPILFETDVIITFHISP